jgi:hypothetical protein
VQAADCCAPAMPSWVVTEVAKAVLLSMLLKCSCLGAACKSRQLAKFLRNLLRGKQSRLLVGEYMAFARQQLQLPV